MNTVIPCAVEVMKTEASTETAAIDRDRERQQQARREHVVGRPVAEADA